jgi:hypothetical protein
LCAVYAAQPAEPVDQASLSIEYQYTYEQWLAANNFKAHWANYKDGWQFARDKHYKLLSEDRRPATPLPASPKNRPKRPSPPKVNYAEHPHIST